MDIGVVQGNVVYCVVWKLQFFYAICSGVVYIMFFAFFLGACVFFSEYCDDDDDSPVKLLPLCSFYSAETVRTSKRNWNKTVSKQFRDSFVSVSFHRADSLTLCGVLLFRSLNVQPSCRHVQNVCVYGVVQKNKPLADDIALNQPINVRFRLTFECKRSVRILSVGTKYSAHDLLRDVTSHCAWSCDVGKISVDDRISTKNPKRDKVGVKKFQSKGWSGNWFHRIFRLLIQ